MLLPAARVLADNLRDATLVENGIDRKVDISSVFEQDLPAKGYIKTADNPGNAVCLRNKQQPEGHEGARDGDTEREIRAVDLRSNEGHGRSGSHCTEHRLRAVSTVYRPPWAFAHDGRLC